MKKTFLSVFLLLVTSCGEPVGSKSDNSTSTNSPSSTEQNLEQFASGELKISSNEEDAFWGFIDLQGQWNYYAGIYVEAYLDDNVGIDEFLEIGIYSYNELVEIYNQMASNHAVFQTPLLIDMFTPALNNYYKKIDALYTILEGVDSLNIELEERGILLLDEAAEEGRQIACDLFQDLNSESIRSILQPPDLAKLDSLENTC